MVVFSIFFSPLFCYAKNDNERIQLVEIVDFFSIFSSIICFKFLLLLLLFLIQNVTVLSENDGRNYGIRRFGWNYLVDGCEDQFFFKSLFFPPHLDLLSFRLLICIRYNCISKRFKWTMDESLFGTFYQIPFRIDFMKCYQSRWSIWLYCSTDYCCHPIEQPVERVRERSKGECNCEKKPPHQLKSQCHQVNLWTEEVDKNTWKSNRSQLLARIQPTTYG